MASFTGSSLDATSAGLFFAEMGRIGIHNGRALSFPQPIRPDTIYARTHLVLALPLAPLAWFLDFEFAL